MPESSLIRATRRSIRDNFPLGSLMSIGRNNPITLHSVDSTLFASVWSLIAETIVVTGELSRCTKEAIATLVSERNSCPVCIKAHSMMSIFARRADKRARTTPQHKQAVQYAEVLLRCVNAQRSPDGIEHYNAFPLSLQDASHGWEALNEAAKAEVALVVALFLHVNRVVSALMGEEMSTAMMKVPRAAAKAMETKTAIKVMSHILSPLMMSKFTANHQRGFTSSLFAEGPTKVPSKYKLPKQFQNLQAAGPERAQAMARLLEWVANYESDLVLEGSLLDYDLIRWADATASVSSQDNITSENPIETTEQDVLRWIQRKVQLELKEESSTVQALAVILVLTVLAPMTIYKSPPWKDLVSSLGEEQARSMVVFWSLRTTLQEAKILFDCSFELGDSGDEEEYEEKKEQQCECPVETKTRVPSLGRALKRPASVISSSFSSSVGFVAVLSL